MAKAKQNRRLARSWAARLGAAAGVSCVHAYIVDEEILLWPDFDRAASLSGLDREGSWDTPAIDADAAGIDGCPRGFEGAYYEAYDRAACAHVRELQNERA